MTTLKIIAVSYMRPIALRLLCDSFRLQTSPRWELHVVHDGPYPESDIDEIIKEPKSLADDKRIIFYNSVERHEKYGHPNRRAMLKEVPVKDDDWILITNDDNYYCPVFVESILKAVTQKTGLIYFNMVHSGLQYGFLNTQLAINAIDMGSFCVRADLAKATGFNSTKHNADGIYAVECLAQCKRFKKEVVKLDNILFVHN